MKIRFAYSSRLLPSILTLSGLLTFIVAPACSSDDDSSETSAGAGGSSASAGRAGAAQSSAGRAGSGASAGNGGSSVNGGSGGDPSLAGADQGGDAGDSGAAGAAGETANGGTTGVEHCQFHTAPTAGQGGSAGGTGGGANVDVGVTTSKTIGPYLTDGQGRTLYIFGSDVPGDCSKAPVTACSGAPCNQTWDRFYTASRVLGSGLQDSEFGDFSWPTTPAVSNTTYHGWPLYTYVGDGPGMLTGQGIATLWHAVKLPFFNVMLMRKKLNDTTTLKYISDGEGYALYASSGDKAAVNGQPAKSNCDATCTAAWPPFELDRFILPSSFKDSDFSLFVRADGKLQVAYRGLPLYRFANDAKPGDTLGHSVSTFKLADPAL